MKVSLNTVKQFTKVALPIDELVAKINGQLGGVEGVTDLGVRYEGATIVKVISCVKHPNADRLNVCMVDDGGVTKGATRDADGFVQVVCGAPNVREGLFVVWLPPGSTVPASYVEDEPFVLAARELRGVVSNGMLASPQELGLGDSHDGLLVLDPEEWLPTGATVKPGASFAEVYGLDDTIIDIENKMFTHRPDCFGVIGVAREIAGIQHQSFTSPDWYKVLPAFNSGDGLDLTVKNDASTVVPRFMAAVIKGVEVEPSPIWLQAELVRLGSKPINNIVDVTNYVMLLTGQPLHAYDYDRLEGAQLSTRLARKGEKTGLLNGKTYELEETDIVIVDGQKIVGLGGVMGGGNSEVSDTTKNIVLECATFDMYAVRKTSMRHGLFTDAVTRFNKGQSPLQNEHVLSLAMQSIHDVAGGELASQVFDAHGRKKLAPPHSVQVSLSFINARLGLTLGAKEVASLLQNVEFGVDDKKEGKDVVLAITSPFWRTDIELPEDVVEEVGRLYGFDKLPRELPQRSIAPATANIRLELKRRMRESLSGAGANEVLTYSFVHERVLQAAGQDPTQAFQLSNALSPDLQYYRLSILPSLLDKVHSNIKNGFDQFALFEFGKAHHKQNMDKDNLPVETELMEMVYASKSPQKGAAYFHATRYVRHIAQTLGVEVSFEPIDKKLTYAGLAPYDLNRSAFIKAGDEQTIIGTVGELDVSVEKAFKLPAYTAAVTVDIASLERALGMSTSSYKPLSRYPSVWQDISLKTPATLAYAELYETIRHATQKAAGEWRVEIQPRTIYQDTKDTDHKTTTLRLTVTSLTDTLTDKDVTRLLDDVEAAAKPLGATRI